MNDIIEIEDEEEITIEEEWERLKNKIQKSLVKKKGEGKEKKSWIQGLMEL